MNYIDPLVNSTPWSTNIGHELTFTVEGTENDWIIFHNDDYYSSIAQKISKSKRSFITSTLKKKVNCAVHEDVGCIEAVSGVIKSWGEFVEWNRTVRDIAKLHRVKPQVEHCVGGGGHHHIDKLSPSQTDYIFRIMAAHPYLAWMFIHPADTVNAVSVAHWEYSRTRGNLVLSPGGFYLPPSNSKYPQWKGVSLCEREYLGTIEWRAFDSAEDMEMQIEHTAFLQALVTHVKKCAPSKVVKGRLFKSATDAKELRDSYGKNFNKSSKEFLECIKTLGLPKNRYEKYIDTHLKPRIKWGNAI